MRRPRSKVFWIGTAVLVAVIAALTASLVLGGDDEPTPLLRVDLIDDGINAVRDAAGGEVAFYEVNATPDLVNLFAQVEGADGTTSAVSYVYSDEGGLGAPETLADPTGSTFTADLVSFEPDTVLGPTSEELPSSIPRLFSITGAIGVDGPASAVEYRIIMESLEGGSLGVLVRPDGSVIGVDAE